MKQRMREADRLAETLGVMGVLGEEDPDPPAPEPPNDPGAWDRFKAWARERLDTAESAVKSSQKATKQIGKALARKVLDVLHDAVQAAREAAPIQLGDVRRLENRAQDIAALISGGAVLALLAFAYFALKGKAA